MTGPGGGSNDGGDGGTGPGRDTALIRTFDLLFVLCAIILAATVLIGVL